MARNARVRLENLEMRLKMACSSSFLLLLLDLSSFLLAISLLLILLGVVFNFLVGYGIVLAERLRKQERKMLLAFVTFLSLSLWLLGQNMTRGGGNATSGRELREREREFECLFFLFF